MSKEGYRTLVIMPSRPEKRTLKFSFSHPAWIALICLFGIVLLVSGAGSWGLFQCYELKGKASQLETENQGIRVELQNQLEKNTSLTKELVEIRKKTSLIKGFLGLEEGNEKAKLGQGGLELSPQSLSFSSDKKNPPNPSHAAPTEIAQLNKDLRKITGLLNEKQKRLECTPSISPVDHKEAWISSSYGNRTSPFTGKRQFHPGIDIAGRKGASIFVTAKGKVTFVGKNGLLGLTVKIRHDSVYQTMYGHLLKAAVKKGQSVDRGEIIGYMGDSGRSTGYHVHYEIDKNAKHTNPYAYMMDWNETQVVLAVGEE